MNEINLIKTSNHNSDRSCRTTFRISKIKDHSPLVSLATAEKSMSETAPKSFNDFWGSADEITCEGLEDLLEEFFMTYEREALVTGLAHRNKKYKPHCNLRWNGEGKSILSQTSTENREDLFRFRHKEPVLFVLTALGDKHAAESVWSDFCALDESLSTVGFLRISRPYDESLHSTLQTETIRSLASEWSMSNLYLHEFCCIAESGEILDFYYEKIIDRFTSENWGGNARKSAAIAFIDGLFPHYVLNPLTVSDRHNSEVTCELRSGGLLSMSSVRGARNFVALC